MATLYTDRSNLQLPAAGADTWTRDKGVDVTGNILHQEARYTATGATATSDVIRLCKLPANTVLLPEQCKIIREAMGSAFNIASIGDEPVVTGAFTGSATRYSTAVNITAAGTSDFAFAAQPAALNEFILPADAWITATLGTVTTPTAGKIAKFSLAYKAAV
jgi:hypothetical protein